MRIMFVGDVNLGEYYTSLGNGPGTYAKTNYIFSDVHDLFQKADFVVGNLEAPVTSIFKDKGDPEDLVLKVDPDIAKQLKVAGFKVLQVANNHSLQHGYEAFKESLSHLDAMGIKAVGLRGQDVVIIENNNCKIGFVAASDVPDNTFKDQQVYQTLDDDFYNLVDQSIPKVDHLVVMLHWGLESATNYLPYQEEVANILKSKGVSAIIGSHPHLFYEVDVSPQNVCAYSLGNFVFDLCWDSRLLKSGILEVDFQRERLSARLWPVAIRNNGSKPVLEGSKIEASRSVKVYNLGNSLKFQTFKKTLYMIRNLGKGYFLIKVKFLLRKLKKGKFYSPSINGEAG